MLHSGRLFLHDGQKFQCGCLYIVIQCYPVFFQYAVFYFMKDAIVVIGNQPGIGDQTGQSPFTMDILAPDKLSNIP